MSLESPSITKSAMRPLDPRTTIGEIEAALNNAVGALGAVKIDGSYGIKLSESVLSALIFNTKKAAGLAEFLLRETTREAK